jgi:hypothetical protein
MDSMTSGYIQRTLAKDESCPHCGYCKHCGRGGHQTYPYYPYYPHTYPWYQTPWITYTGSDVTIQDMGFNSGTVTVSSNG